MEITEERKADENTPLELPSQDDDLEDGEIETDEDDDEPVITAIIPADKNHDTVATKKKSSLAAAAAAFDSDVEVVTPTIIEKKTNKFKRPDIVDDDWAGNIEHAIAAALKKDGIEPSLPKLEKRLIDDIDRLIDKADSSDDLRKNRKRKKREEKEKNKKRSKHQEQDHSKQEPDDIDEDEMLCVRGGSPPPMGAGHMLPISHHLHLTGSLSPPINVSSGFYDSDDSYSSYGSYDSAENRKMSYDERRQSRRGKDRRQRKFTDGGGSGQAAGRGSSQGGAGGSGKRRHRKDSDGGCIPNLRGHCNDGDDCNRSHDGRAQRKLELCKFYLMDCCAKKDKCSYMHGDFPCKYYYLGMECVYKTECKFSHGKPLTEQLRNILLKHIETAPKEILGNFRRISRENATSLLLITHAKLCSEHGVENTMEAPSPQPFLRQSRSPTDHRAGNPFGTPSNSSMSQMDQVSPRKDDKDKSNSIAKNDKPRKSRWCDFSSASPTAILPTPLGGQQHQPVVSPTPPISSSLLLNSSNISSQSDILSLKNLKGVITPEQIDKLSAIGIENLEQISQLTVAQLNNVGLTIGQINEIQLNALNIQKLGLISNNSTPAGVIGAQCPNSSLNLTSSLSITSVPTKTTPNLFNDDSQPVNSTTTQDVDMRFLVGVVQASTTQTVSTTNSQLIPLLSSTSAINIQDIGIASPEPTPNSGNIYPSTNNPQDAMLLTSAVIASTMPVSNDSVVDVSQYLKDSNLDGNKTDFNDLMTDDKDDDDALNEDEPELLIDESRSPSDDEADLPNQSMTTEKDINTTTSNQEQPMPAIYDPKLFLPPTTKFNVVNWADDEENWDDDCDKKEHNRDDSDKNVNLSGCDDDWSDARSGRDDDRSCGGRDDNRSYGRDVNRSGGGRDDNRSGGGREYYGTGGRNDYYGSGIRDDYYGSGGRDDARGRCTSMYEENNRDDHKESSNTDQYRDPRGYFNKQSNSATIPSNPVNNYDGDWGATIPSKAVNNYGRDWGATIPSKPVNNYDSDWGAAIPSKSVNNYEGDRGAIIPSKPVANYDGDWSTTIPSTPVNNFDRDWSATIPSTPVNNYDGDWDTDDEKENDYDDVQVVEVIPPVIVEPSPPTKYHRASIYDGTPKSSNDDDDDDDDNDDRFCGSNATIDRDSSDIDLRLPFKPVMTNYTPATEIDGSISSHAPITYKVYDVSIPNPDYSEIRRTMTVTEKTLDPRLRRIFCMKDAANDQYGSDCELLRSPPQSSLMLSASTKSEPLVGGIGAPRIDPRRRKETQDTGATSLLNRSISMTGSSSTMLGIGQNVDIRLLLQKSHWYKNLNSKFKIMVNQQLALVSTELKKFHQDPSLDKVFDMKFLATNQYLQQVLTNLGIFIDCNGQILQLDGENDDQMTGGLGMLMAGGGMMMDMPSMGMDFMRPPQPGMVMNPRFMGGIMNSYGPRFGDIRPGLLGVAPGVNPFNNNPFDSGSAPLTDQFGGGFNDDYGSGGNDQQSGFGGGNNSGGNNNPFDQGSNSGGKFYGQRHGTDGSDSGGRQLGNRGNRNFRQAGNSRNTNNSNNGNSNDRWGSSGGGGVGQGRNGPGRNRNYEARGGGRDRDGGRREKQNLQKTVMACEISR